MRAFRRSYHLGEDTRKLSFHLEYFFFCGFFLRRPLPPFLYTPVFAEAFNAVAAAVVVWGVTYVCFRRVHRYRRVQ